MIAQLLVKVESVIWRTTIKLYINNFFRPCTIYKSYIFLGLANFIGYYCWLHKLKCHIEFTCGYNLMSTMGIIRIFPIKIVKLKICFWSQ
jgi:hypothetical protein